MQFYFQLQTRPKISRNLVRVSADSMPISAKLSSTRGDYKFKGKARTLGTSRAVPLVIRPDKKTLGASRLFYSGMVIRVPCIN